jgi:hypothetical protein
MTVPLCWGGASAALTSGLAERLRHLSEDGVGDRL